MGNKVYQIVTDRIIKKLEEGVIPWRQPWTSAQAVNWVTQKPYRGINALLLDPGEYLTWNQVKQAKGKVKKGSKSNIVVFFKTLEIEEENSEGGTEKKTIPYLRYYRVFNLKDCEGIKSKRKTETFDHNPLKVAETLVNDFQDKPEIQFAPGKAYYRPGLDIVSVPEISYFPKRNKYYCTLFHELIHSTGHKKRLNRTTLTEAAAFGSELYSKEELVAEIGASMLCAVTHIDNDTIDNSAAYINSWIRRLKKDNRLIAQAASAAQKAANYIQNIKPTPGPT